MRVLMEAIVALYAVSIVCLVGLVIRTRWRDRRLQLPERLEIPALTITSTPQRRDVASEVNRPGMSGPCDCLEELVL